MADNEPSLAEIALKLEEHERILKKVEKYLFWQHVWNGVKIVLIIAPLIASLIFLPPLIEQLTQQLAPFLAPGASGLAPDSPLNLPQTLSPFAP